MVKRKKKKKKLLKKPKLPANEAYWLAVSGNKNDIETFIERGNERQKKELKLVMEYRLWQIQEGTLDKNFFKDIDVDVKNLNIDVKAPPKSKKKKEKLDGKIVDLFDMNNIEDLVESGR